MIKSARRNISIKIATSIYVMLNRIVLKRILHCIRNNMYLAELHLIETFAERYSDQDLTYRINLSTCVARKLFYGKYPSDKNAFYEGNKAIIESEIANAKSCEYIKERLKDDCELTKYYYQDMLDLVPEEYPQRDLIKSECIRLLSKSEFSEKCKTIAVELKKVKKPNIKKIKAQLKKEEIAQLPKWEVSSSAISMVFALFSILFLCTGFIYIHIYLGYFGIHISNYFEISDYLAASADKIYYAVMSLIITLVFSLLFYPEYIQGRLPEKPKSKILLAIDNVLYKSLTPMLGLSTTIAYISKNEDAFYLTSRMFIFLLSLQLIVVFMRLSKHPIRNYFILTSVVLFLTNVIFGAVDEINLITQTDNNKIAMQNVYFMDKTNSAEKNLMLMIANSKYYFFYSREKKITLIYPSSDIAKVVAKNEIAHKGVYKWFVDWFSHEAEKE